MTIKNLAKQTFFWSIIIVLISCSGNQNETQTFADKPNIIYILTDDLGYGDLSCYGQKILKTPHLDKMAEEGIRFTQHYAGSPVCAPSRAILMTGRAPGHSRVRGNYEIGPHGFGGELPLRPEDITIAEILKSSGYKTANIGKWGMGMDGTTGEPNKKGFDYAYGFLNQAHAHWQYPEYLFLNGKKVDVKENAGAKQNYFSNDIFTDATLNYLKQQKGDEPFFLYLTYVTPHAEMLVPKDSIWNSYKEKFKDKAFTGSPTGSGGNRKDSMGYYHSQPYPQTAFASMITHIDNDVKKILDQLKAQGMDENTLVMFSSDNGPHKEGGHDPAYFKSSGELRGVKRDLYEGGIRVPFIVRWPAKIKPGHVSDQISAFWDMLATLADVAKADTKNIITEGVSLLPIFLGKNEDQKQHDYLYWEFHENKFSNQAVRKGKWKAVRLDPDAKMELYNLENDISEKNNVADKNPEVVKEMEIVMKKARTPNPYWPLKSSKN
ncbi:MAG TPA: arylsulfatase [Sphingobacteriaceae bacterium]|nr:arylsulfatase [Sphingobacteriaceae bacterium]